MKVKIYSHSRLSTFEQCRLKFKYRYIDKITPEIEMTIEAHLGKCVHDTLEALYNTMLENKSNNQDTIPSLDQLITYYSNRWQENFSPSIVIVNQTLTARDYFDKGIQFIIDYYTKHYPFDDNTLECEKKIIIDNVLI